MSEVPTGLGGQTVLFAPEETLRPDKSPLEPGHPDEVTLAINYPLLQTLQKAREQPTHSLIRQTETPSRTHSRETAITPNNQKTVPAQGESVSEDPALRALQEQVHKQERDMEKLKNDLQEIQRRRGSP